MMETTTQHYLSNRRELLFLYDIQMGNPNGDPDENRPRLLPDGTVYVTDVRLKRFVRDYFKHRGLAILVDSVDEQAATLTDRVTHYLKTHNLTAENKNPVSILLQHFIDARLFGSALAFKKGSDNKPIYNPIPKTLTGPVQFNIGEVLHQADIIDIAGTSIMASDSDKTQGTFTDFSVLRYGLIGFSGVANQHSAQISQMTAQDYDQLLKALWNGVRVNTRSKIGQVPLLLISVEYQDGQDFQIGRLHDFVRCTGTKPELAWRSPADYTVDLTALRARLENDKSHIKQIRYMIAPELQLTAPLPRDEMWKEFKANDQ